MKKIKLDAETEGIPSTALREISTLRELRHPNIVWLLDVVLDHKRLYLIFEYLDMDLKDWLSELKAPMPVPLLKSFLYQVLCFYHPRDF
jgi:serine/threonine protein kinase